MKVEQVSLFSPKATFYINRNFIKGKKYIAPCSKHLQLYHSIKFSKIMVQSLAFPLDSKFILKASTE